MDTYDTDTSLLRTVQTVRLVPECHPYLYIMDTSVKQTLLGSVRLVSVLKRFDCILFFYVNNTFFCALTL